VNPNEDKVRCTGLQGELLGKTHLPESVATVTFGGLRRRDQNADRP